MAATLMGALRKRIMAPDTADSTFAVRGFDTADAPARQQLEMSALQFLIGFEFGIEQKGHEALVTRLETLEEEYRGFAYEGAVMALAIRDVMSPAPGNRLTESFLAGPRYDSALGSKHVFMAYIGLGFALARLPKMLWNRALPNQSGIVDHPSLRWLIMDGYGFHMAFFDHHKWVDGQYVAKRYPWPGPADYTNRVIDQGIGRAMWFVHGGNVERLLAGIGKFPPPRRSDLMCGAGLAATYAGGVGAEELEALWKGAGEYRPEVAQGAVFALRARAVSGLVTPHNELASQIFCGRDAYKASDIGAEEIVDLPPDGAVPAYEVFRQRVQDRFR
jgi:hypothetical protein